MLLAILSPSVLAVQNTYFVFYSSIKIIRNNTRFCEVSTNLFLHVRFRTHRQNIFVVLIVEAHSIGISKDVSNSIMKKINHMLHVFAIIIILIK